MANWVITWINGGKFKGKQILPTDYVKEALSSHTIVNADPPDAENPDIQMSNYGYGWFLSSYKGHYRAEHGGNIDGFSANVCVFPTDSLGIVVLTNQNGSVLPSLVRNTISDRMLNLKRTDWHAYYTRRREDAEKQQAAARNAARSSQKKNTRPSHSLAEYTGTYHHPGYGRFSITFLRDSLFAHTPLKTFWLKHYHYDVFVPYEKEKGKIDTTAQVNFKFSFLTNDAGEIASALIKLEPAVEPLEFTRTPLKMELTREALQVYAGEYELAGTTVRFYLKDQAPILYLMVPGQPEYELLPTEKHVFAIKNLNGFKVVFSESVGQITEVTFIQPHGTFTGKRK